MTSLVYGLLIFTVMSIRTHHIVVAVDFSLSPGVTACQRNFDNLADILSTLHANHPRWRISVYSTGTYHRRPTNPIFLMELRPLSVYDAMALLDKRTRNNYRTTLKQKIIERLNSKRDIVGECTNCSALKYSLSILNTLVPDAELFILLSDGLDEGPSERSIAKPVLIFGNLPKSANFSKIRRIWRGWNVRILGGNCDTEHILTNINAFMR